MSVQDHEAAVLAQQHNALGLANEQRLAMKNLKLALSLGSVSLREVLLPHPRATVNRMYAVDLVRLTPRFTDVVAARVGRRAAQAGVNLLVPCLSMPDSERRWLVELIEKGAAGKDKDTPSRVESVAQIDLAQRRVEAVEVRLRKALAANEVLEEQVRNHQFRLPTDEANELLDALADVVEEHRRAVTDQTLPPAVWAGADEVLWAAKNAILEHGMGWKVAA